MKLNSIFLISFNQNIGEIMNIIKVTKAMITEIKEEHENEIFHDVEEEIHEFSKGYIDINKPCVINDGNNVFFYKMEMKINGGKREYSLSVAVGDVVEVFPN